MYMESIKYKCCWRGCSAWELSNATFRINLIDCTNSSLSNRDNRSGKPLFEQYFDYLTPHNRTSLLFILPPTIPITPYPLLINVNLFPPIKNDSVSSNQYNCSQRNIRILLIVSGWLFCFTKFKLWFKLRIWCECKRMYEQGGTMKGGRVENK